MKIEVDIFVVRNKLTNEVLHAEGIQSEYSDVGYTYTKEYITKDELKDYLIFSYGPKGNWVKEKIIDFEKSGKYYDSGNAKDMPSIGNIACNIESHEMEVV